jgi:putative exosortase-associated protein (TIGR04073 family)
MKTFSLPLLSALLVSSTLAFAPLAQADDEIEDSFNDPLYHQSKQTYGNKSYGDKVGEKALQGFTNINTAPLEIPKSIINMTNQTDNIILGVTGGFVKGAVNTLGRFAIGLTDLVTAPIITQPMVKPAYVWEDFDAETTYGPVLRLDNQAQVDRDEAR